MTLLMRVHECRTLIEPIPFEWLNCSTVCNPFGLITHRLFLAFFRSARRRKMTKGSSLTHLFQCDLVPSNYLWLRCKHEPTIGYKNAYDYLCLLCVPALYYHLLLDRKKKMKTKFFETTIETISFWSMGFILYLICLNFTVQISCQTSYFHQLFFVCRMHLVSLSHHLS